MPQASSEHQARTPCWQKSLKPRHNPPGTIPSHRNPPRWQQAGNMTTTSHTHGTRTNGPTHTKRESGIAEPLQQRAEKMPQMLPGAGPLRPPLSELSQAEHRTHKHHGERARDIGRDGRNPSEEDWQEPLYLTPLRHSQGSIDELQPPACLAAHQFTGTPPGLRYATLATGWGRGACRACWAGRRAEAGLPQKSNPHPSVDPVSA